MQLVKQRPLHEPELIDKAKLGDKSAFKQLYQLHHQRVYALCLRITGQVSLAEEATQDCFVRLWQKLPQFRGESQFTTWLHTLSVNQALSNLKKHRSFWSRFVSSDTDLQSVSDEYEDLDKLLLKLPERARIVFVLHALEGYKHEEVGQLMGIAPGTSKAQYHRAQKLLESLLDPDKLDKGGRNE
ncbi:RNA polymerase, sigma-24 subunit, ECF subfamily [Shewanella halifaxensis HAW-EB4]|uniref:RNA polymerase, sigma-24 subunit, ECF subfamily n=1 Tax=Shewanella halifaxensis (strain HAW-EB4) TaxID=458817 RepID=B0TR69_SHEHH|nr:RNA polymerase sigma factor [Shewanella halifaxensis]ABZ77800.1 RNA polymerase, sigma-24 subunit, ECF subfamily [Shewanella halifaxensis HAW-EB4]